MPSFLKKNKGNDTEPIENMTKQFLQKTPIDLQKVQTLGKFNMAHIL